MKYMEKAILFFSGPVTHVMTNSEIAKYNRATATKFAPLNEKHGGFSLWNGPRYFVANEVDHKMDGLHFAWPGTISNVDMVTCYKDTGYVITVTFAIIGK